MNDHDDLPVLDEEELAMLAAFQAEDRPPTRSVERVRARVLESTAAPPAAVVRGPWQWPVAVALVAAAAAALLLIDFGGEDVTAVNRRGAQQAADTPELGEGDRAVVVDAPTQQVVARPPPPPRVQPARTEAPRSPIAPPEPPARRPTVQPAPAEPAPAQPVSSLVAETRLLDRARKAVAGGRPADALTILQEAESQFPRGVLGQERSALRVVALCDAGQLDAGRKAAASFVKAHPRSALRARVESACPAE